MTRMRLRDGLTIRELPDGDAVVAAGEGDSAIIVNASAHAVLDLLAGGGATQREIVAILCRTFPEAREEDVQRDVAALVADFERNGLVEPCGAGPSTA